MTSGRNRYFVLVFLALLQCFAPLLHAHAHGISVEGKVHIHGEGKAHVQSLLEHEHPGIPSFTVDRDEAPVIAMAQEFRHEIIMALSDAPQLAVKVSFLEFSPARPARVEPVCLAPPGGQCSYLSPFSQAPPFVLI